MGHELQHWIVSLNEITGSTLPRESRTQSHPSRTGTVDELLGAIDNVLSDEIYVSPQIALPVVDKLVGRNLNGCEALSDLTARELDVFSLIGAGHGIGQIADAFGISRKAVETYCERIKIEGWLHRRRGAQTRRA